MEEGEGASCTLCGATELNKIRGPNVGLRISKTRGPTVKSLKRTSNLHTLGGVISIIPMSSISYIGSVLALAVELFDIGPSRVQIPPAHNIYNFLFTRREERLGSGYTS